MSGGLGGRMSGGLGYCTALGRATLFCFMIIAVHPFGFST